MFCDDVNGIAIHIGHLRSYIGYIGDEMPLYQSDSFYRPSSAGRVAECFEDLTRNLASDSLISPLVSNEKVNSCEVYADFMSRFAEKINANLNEVGVVLSMHVHQKSDGERQALAHLLFEQHNVPALYFANKNITSLFSSGKITGTLVDSGAFSTEVVPIVEGFAIRRGKLTSC
jgi:actin-related protein